MVERKHGGGRKREGHLIPRKSGYRAKVTIDVDGEAVQQTFNLETTDKRAAQLKLKRLVKLGPDATAQEAAAQVTIDEFAEKWLSRRELRGIAAVDYERRYYKRIFAPAFGRTTFDKVRVPDAQEIIDQIADGEIMPEPRHEKDVPKPYGLQSIKHIRDTGKRLWKAAMAAELAMKNIWELTELPDVEREVKARAILTDMELVQLVEHPRVDAEIKLLVLLSRTVGGQRAGDLEALDWLAFSPGFEVCTFMRRKTRKKIPFPEPHLVPEVVRIYIDAWHERHHRPVSGPVFPVRRGPRAGQFKKSNVGYAKALRRALLIAGIDRHELHHETPTTLPCDFHSTRRGFATAGVNAGLSEQQIMGLGGWSDSKLINRYKDKLTPKALPPGMVPAICPERAVSILPKT